MQTSALKTSSMIAIDLRESVPYYIEQAKDLLLVHFDASSIPPKPVEQADLPSWKKVVAQTVVEPTLRKAQEPVKRIGPVSAPTRGIVTETPLDAADYDIDAQRRIDAYTGKETGLDVFRLYKTKKMYRGEKIALDFYDTDIKNVFLILREVSGKNFAIDKDVTGRVTLTLAKPVPWDQVLDLVLKMNQLGKIYEGKIIRIATLATLEAEEKQLKEKLKKKQDAVRQEDHITTFLPVNYGSASAINEKHILPLLTTAEEGRGESQAGKSTVEERLNMIVITDVPLVVKQAREIIQKLDRVTPQVMIEARIVEASDKFSREIGVDWNTGTNATGDALISSSALGADLGYNAAVNFPFSLLKSADAATMGFSIAGSQFVLNAAILAYETQGDLKIVSSPKIVTLDNKKATIKQGIKYPYIKLDESGNATTEFEDIDLVLEVTPHVTSDDRISMVINITKNDIGSVIASQQSFDTKEASTELLIDNGNTVVIGGIIKTTKHTYEGGVPWLSKIPVLGWLFKTEYKKDNKEELLIFITPKIVQLEQQNL
ncbi:MAG: type IV pilus secretin PilQ, partial [Candidatus Aerophobetes bacterium]|nr:type IV pilus secretin PilQ [Candidatus Aerophobetes bacterium]